MMTVQPSARKCAVQVLKRLRTTLATTRANQIPQCHIKRPDPWESRIGLEVHAQISSKSKMFSGAEAKYGAPANTLVDLLDAAIPGTLPVLNEACVKAGVLTAMALSCEINPCSTFDRKHYFYADLPAGYQITQQRSPLAKHGHLDYVVFSSAVHKHPYEHSCRIRQVQLEQDSGKSLHDANGGRSLIDLNRAGTGLMEIVFEPDLRDGEEAAALIKELILILESHETCSCRMEHGALRIDANISVNRSGEPLGVRTEVKNLGSIRAVANSIEYEVKRQIQVLESGGLVVNETRAYDAEAKQTVPMRDKEVKQDYRFMPEPNLPPLRLTYSPSDHSSGVVNMFEVMKGLKELPDVTRRKLINNFGLRMEIAIRLRDNPEMLSYFHSVMEPLPKEYGVKAANLIVGPLTEFLHKLELQHPQCPIPTGVISDVAVLLSKDDISPENVSKLLDILLQDHSKPVLTVVKENNLLQINDEDTIADICRQILSENPEIVDKYRKKGKPRHFTKLVSLVHKRGEGQLNMVKCVPIMRGLLGEPANDSH